MAELRSARRYRVIHLRLAAKLEMQLTISAFCFSAPHMLRRKGGKGDRTRGSYKPLPQPQVSLAQLAQWLHKDLVPDKALARLDISALQEMRFLPKRASDTITWQTRTESSDVMKFSRVICNKGVFKETLTKKKTCYLMFYKIQELKLKELVRGHTGVFSQTEP